MWRNFSTWQIFSTFLMWRNFPLDRFVSTFLMWRNFSMWQSFPTFIMWRNFPLDNMSWGEFLHMTNFFSTDAVCRVCDKYQVWFCIENPSVVLKRQSLPSSRMRPEVVFKNRAFIKIEEKQHCPFCSLGKPSFKKNRNFMKNFHKMVTPPPVLYLWNPYSDFYRKWARI